MSDEVKNDGRKYEGQAAAEDNGCFIIDKHRLLRYLSADPWEPGDFGWTKAESNISSLRGRVIVFDKVKNYEKEGKKPADR